MTLSNFDWTDKDSVKWFVLLPTGHEGPYSLDSLQKSYAQKRIASDVKVWAEGLNEPILLSDVLGRANSEEISEIPDLPPIPEEDVPPLPIPEDAAEDVPPLHEIPSKPRRVWPVLVGAVVIMCFLAFAGMIKKYENFTIRRYPKMTLELHEKILRDLSFDGWNKKIFFKEYLPSDQTQIWLVTSSYQTCKVEASFQSLDQKLLSMQDEKVQFKTEGILKDHVVEFSQFDFLHGTKIIPGMYEMDVKAYDCSWDGFLPRIMNKFMSPDESYVARTKVVLFSKGAEEFNRILDKLIQKKMAIELKEKNETENFWQDLQQKLETLQAITMQIEQLILEFLAQGPNRFQPGLKPMVDLYTKKFGSFLTSFVVENEKYFRSLNISDSTDASQKRNYELMVKLTSKKIGFESMTFIEEFQNMKGKPTVKSLEDLTARVRKTYSGIKIDIGQKIIQVSEDRSK